METGVLLFEFIVSSLETTGLVQSIVEFERLRVQFSFLYTGLSCEGGRERGEGGR